MKAHALLITTCGILLSTMIANGYLFFDRQELNKKVQTSHVTLVKKNELIQMARKNVGATSEASHRLALPSGRLQAGHAFETVSQRFHLDRFNFQISPETNLETTFSPEDFTESTVELKFNHHHDAPLFQMIYYVLHHFPGLVYPSEIVMWRDLDAPSPQIQGHFKFKWLKTKTEDFEG